MPCAIVLLGPVILENPAAVYLSTRMKTRTDLLPRSYSTAAVRIFGSIALSLAVDISTSSAAPLYWDGTDTTADADGGAGTWDGSATNWDDAATAGNPVSWTASDDAVFGGVADSVTVSGNQQASSLTFDVDGYTLTGGTLTLAGTLPGVSVGDIAHSATIQSTLAGTDGFTKSGSGSLTVSNAGNSYTGATTVSGGLLVLNQTANYVQAIAQSSQLTVSSGAEVRITGGVNAFQRSTSDAAVILDGGIFDYQASTHGHMGNRSESVV